MSFHTTGAEFRVENNHVLKGRLTKSNGESHNAEIDLNQFIGNKDGEDQCGPWDLVASAVG